MNLRIIGLVGVIVAVVFGAPAYAALVNLSVMGTVDSVDSGNPFGLMAGDTVTAQAMFDDSGLIPGSGFVNKELGETGNANGSMLTLFIGNIELKETNDRTYQTIFPLLIFFDGQFQSFNFNAEANKNESPVDFMASSVFTGQSNLVGEWDIINASITPKAVPLPASFWLFGSGLIGLFGLRHRNKQISTIA